MGYIPTASIISKIPRPYLDDRIWDHTYDLSLAVTEEYTYLKPEENGKIKFLKEIFKLNPLKIWWSIKVHNSQIS